MYQSVNDITLDQRLARLAARPLSRLRVHPNWVTTASLCCGVAAAWCFLAGTQTAANYGAAWFIGAVLCDHIDGEVARQSGTASRFGYYYDFIVGGLIYALLFAAIGVGFAAEFAPWGLALGLSASLCNPAILWMRLRMDETYGLAATAHPRFGWINLEDFIYAIGPLIWFCGVAVFYVPFALGTLAYLIWTIGQYRRWFGARHEPV